MSRRRRKRAIISLFAFQDIIMAVSGIVIVVVLLLTLELVERPDVSGDGGMHAVAALLQQTLAEAEGELATLRRATAEHDSGVRDLADVASADFAAEIASLETRQRDLDQDIAKARQQSIALEAGRRTAEAAEFDARPLVSEIEELAHRQAALEESLETASDRPVYTMPRGDDRRGWLVVLRGVEIAAAPIGSPQPPLVFRKEGIFSRSAENAFLEWARRQDRASSYFLLLVKPSGAASYDRIETALRTDGFGFGFDLAAEDRIFLDFERGAAP